MTKNKPASLAGVFAAKGTAKPADATKPIDPQAVSPTAPLEQPTTSTESVMQEAPVAVIPATPLVVNMPMATKSLTVKVDLATYTKLKAHGGALGGKTNQDIFVEALALYFKKYGIQ